MSTSLNAEQPSLVEARFEAQKIVFGPMIFQAARLLRDLGILKALRAAHSGLTQDEITAQVETSRFSTNGGSQRDISGNCAPWCRDQEGSMGVPRSAERPRADRLS